MKTLNRTRARRCDRALRDYNTRSETADCLSDFLADARHWCDRHGHSYAELDRQAYSHYIEEVAETRRGTL
jgi:hypothetical protein